MKRKGGGTLTFDDFLPDNCKPPPPTEEEMENRLKAKMMAMAKSTGTYHGS
jgi:hypothetical protein